MSTNSRDPDIALTAPLYLVAVTLIVMPAIDFLQSVGQPQLLNVQWRFATVGLLSSYLVTPLLGISMAMVIAAFRQHVVFQRIISVITLIAAAALLIMLVGFVLDVLQLRAAVPEDGRAGFESASLRAVVKHALSFVVLALLGVRGFRSSSWRPARAQVESVRIVGR